jgi:tetratricopeptide (TPR) repeat protein
VVPAGSTKRAQCTIAPGDLDIIAEKAETYLAEGNLDATWQIVGNLKLSYPNRGFQIDVLTYRRQFDEAIAQLSSALGPSNNTQRLFVAIGHAWLGELHVAKGDHVKAQPLFVQAEQEFKSLRAGGDNSFLLADILVQVEARLGHRDEVETDASSILQRIKKDAWGFAREEYAVARAYTALGDFDRAVPLLQHALATPASQIADTGVFAARSILGSGTQRSAVPGALRAEAAVKPRGFAISAIGRGKK